jgi:hypothetical protein
MCCNCNSNSNAPWYNYISQYSNSANIKTRFETGAIKVKTGFASISDLKPDSKQKLRPCLAKTISDYNLDCTYKKK